MRISYKNIEPSEERKKGCANLEDLDKLHMQDLIGSFVCNITKNGNKKEIRQGVVGIVAPWGSGKSFFLNLLFCKLKDTYSTVYLDASIYQHEENIKLVVLQSIIKSNSVSDKFIEASKSSVRDIIKGGGKLLGNKLISSFFKKDSQLEAFKELIEGTSGDFINNMVDSFEETPQEKLKYKLGKVTENHPLVIIIDNLDRCEADFTLEFLSKIKEVFDIKNILFIIAYDKDRVKNFIKQKYGDNSTIGFLRKYVSAEFYLSNFETDIGNIIKYFYENVGILNRVEEIEEMKKNNNQNYKIKDSGNPISIKDLPTYLLEELYKNSKLTLRMIEQIISRASVVIDKKTDEQLKNKKIKIKQFELDYINLTKLFYVLWCKNVYEYKYYELFYTKSNKRKELFKSKKTNDSEISNEKLIKYFETILNFDNENIKLFENIDEFKEIQMYIEMTIITEDIK